MKYLSIFIIFILSLSTVFASELYTNKIYTSVTLLYWCTYKEMPSSKEDIAKIADISGTNSKLKIDFDEWLESVSYEINGDELSIINDSKGITGGTYQSSVISKSSTNCAAFFERKKKRKELEKFIRGLNIPEPTNQVQDTLSGEEEF